ncbi:MAG: hypothetical protein WD556_02355 [Actinomycetota bacterium]
MSEEPSPNDPAYVGARRVLLDALAALAPQAHAVIVAGAQAIYLRTGGGEVAIAVAPFTTDGDLALDPSQLEDAPDLEAIMSEAGFELLSQEAGHVEPGTWIARTTVDGIQFTVPIDLIVPEGVAAGRGRRGARLGVHGKRAARRAVGLEAALVDHAPMTISALEAGDDRSAATNVAGVAALFVAKLHKLHDRVASESEHRREDKDAGDVIRLMQATSADEVGSTLARLCRHEIAGPVSKVALAYLDELFGRRGRVGIQMAARALRLGMPEDRVEALSVAYTAALLTSASTDSSP